MLLDNFKAFGGLVVALILQSLHREFGAFGSVTDDLNVNSICKKHYRQTATRYVSYREIYSPNPWSSLRLSKWNYRTETFPQWVLIDVCCDGYEFLPTTTDILTCIPVCKNGCDHGQCQKPNICGCDTGYRPSINESTSYVTCEPDCPSGCIGGRCIAPSTCTCNDGYVLTNDSAGCDISCSSVAAGGPENCGNNASCVGPNQCQCNDGYVTVVNLTLSGDTETASNHDDSTTMGRTDRWPSVNYHRPIFNTSAVTCAPLCEPKCGKGAACVAPNQCQCTPGYEYSTSVTSGRSNDTACLPVCDKVCVNGFCGAPNKCHCQKGYKPDAENDDDSVCVAMCKADCINGLCTEPDHCECNDGYEKLSVQTGLDGNASLDNVCAPVCSGQCLNGRCIAPGHCICNLGYVNIVASSSRDATSDGNGGASAVNDGIESDGSIGPSGQQSCQPLCEPVCPLGQVCTAPNRCESQSFRHRDLDEVASNDERNVDSNGYCGDNGVLVELDGSCRCYYGWTGSKCTEPSICAVIFINGDDNWKNLTLESVVFHNNGTERNSYVTDRRHSGDRTNWENMKCKQECRIFVSTSKNMSSDAISCHKVELSNATAELQTTEISQFEFSEEDNKTVICLIDVESGCNIEKSNDAPSTAGSIAVYFFLFVLVVGLGSVASYFIDRKISRMKAMRAVQSVNALREQAEATESLYATDDSSHL